MHGPVVGFDLDMTLIDTRPGIAATYRALTARTGVHIDVDTVVNRLGPPLAREIAHWFPPDQVETAVEQFRALYPTQAVIPSSPLPGARGAVDAVRALGGRVIVVTSKLGRLAQLHLDHLGIGVDGLAGDRFEAGKASAITEYGVGIYVGDHLADVWAARTAGALAVGVATGPYGVAELRSAGADAVLPDLREFPAWLATVAADGITVGYRVPGSG